MELLGSLLPTGALCLGKGVASMVEVVDGVQLVLEVLIRAENGALHSLHGAVANSLWSLRKHWIVGGKENKR